MKVAALEAQAAAVPAVPLHLAVHQPVVARLLGAGGDAGVVGLTVLTLDGWREGECCGLS